MGNAYGKTALSASITLPNFDEYLAKIQAAGNNIDDICADAVNAGAKIVYDAMKEGAARHGKGAGKYGTDAVYDAIEITPAKKEGNLIYSTIGIDWVKHPEAKHAVYQEYGDGHSPDFPDPFVRPAKDDHLPEIRKAERDVLKQGGIQTE